MILENDPSFTPQFSETAAKITADGLDGKDFFGNPAYPPSVS